MNIKEGVVQEALYAVTTVGDRWCLTHPVMGYGGIPVRNSTVKFTVSGLQ